MWGDLGFFGRRNKQDAIKRLAIKSGGESPKGVVCEPEGCHSSR